MGEAGHKVFLLLGIALQISHFLLNGAGHGIEAQRQIAYLIQRFHLCPLLVLTGGNAVGGTIQCADGAGIKVGKDQHGGNADGHRKGMEQHKGPNLPVIQVRQCAGGKVSIQKIGRVFYGKHPGAFQNETFIRIQQAVHKLALFRSDTLQEGIKAFIRSGQKGALAVIQGADSLIPQTARRPGKNLLKHAGGSRFIIQLHAVDLRIQCRTQGGKLRLGFVHLKIQVGIKALANEYLPGHTKKHRDNKYGAKADLQGKTHKASQPLTSPTGKDDPLRLCYLEGTSSRSSRNISGS